MRPLHRDGRHSRWARRPPSPHILASSLALRGEEATNLRLDLPGMPSAKLFASIIRTLPPPSFHMTVTKSLTEVSALLAWYIDIAGSSLSLCVCSRLAKVQRGREVLSSANDSRRPGCFGSFVSHLDFNAVPVKATGAHRRRRHRHLNCEGAMEVRRRDVARRRSWNAARAPRRLCALHVAAQERLRELDKRDVLLRFLLPPCMLRRCRVRAPTRARSGPCAAPRSASLSWPPSPAHAPLPRALSTFRLLAACASARTPDCHWSSC